MYLSKILEKQLKNSPTIFLGDYNMTPDRHLGAAWIDKCRPDLLITESTYATTIRDSKRCREMDFLKKVHETIMKGGKVIFSFIYLYQGCPQESRECQELSVISEMLTKFQELCEILILSSAFSQDILSNMSLKKYFCHRRTTLSRK